MRTEISLIANHGGQSEAVAVSGTSAQSAAINNSYAVLYSTVDVFMRQGGSPTALADGTDQLIPGGVLLRVELSDGNKLAFITAGATGTVYLTPGE